MFTDNPEQKYLAAFLAIPFLLDSVSVYCPKTKKLWRPTKAEVKDGFICHIPRTSETGISCSERLEKINALGLTVQPHIVIFGESLNNITKIEVVVNNVHYTLPPTDGIVTAVDSCFKSFHVLNAEYQAESKTVWYFLQAFYKMSLQKKGQAFITVTSLMSDLGMNA